MTYRAFSQLHTVKLSPLSGRPKHPVEDKLRGLGVVSMQLHRKDVYYVTLGDYEIMAVFKPRKPEVYKSNYRAEILAYEVSQKFGFNLVPPTVERSLNINKNGHSMVHKGSLQLFVLGDKYNVRVHASNGKFRHSSGKQDLFDFIIQNNDRGFRNFLIDDSGHIFSIDNGLGFTNHGSHGPSIREINAINDFLITEEGGQIIANLRQVDHDLLRLEIIEYLGIMDTDYLLNRIQVILNYYDMLIRESL